MVHLLHLVFTQHLSSHGIKMNETVKQEIYMFLKYQKGSYCRFQRIFHLPVDINHLIKMTWAGASA